VAGPLVADHRGAITPDARDAPPAVPVTHRITRRGRAGWPNAEQPARPPGTGLTSWRHRGWN